MGNLSLVRQQVATASVPPPPLPAEEPQWHETVLDNVLDAAAWTYNHTAVPLVNTAGNVIEAVAEHPEDLIEMAIGAGMIFLGAGGEVGGFALDATGVGAVAGVPINVASAGLIAGGASTFGHGAGRLVEHAQQKDHRWLQEHEMTLRRHLRGKAGDPLPDHWRPKEAGSTWKGRVPRDTKGEVWQDPKVRKTRDGEPENRRTLRVEDPSDKNPNGAMRYYNDHGQPLTREGKTGTNAETHHPIREDTTYDVPKGWNPG
jgi:hypothetical protein